MLRRAREAERKRITLKLHAILSTSYADPQGALDAVKAELDKLDGIAIVELSRQEATTGVEIEGD